MTKEYEVEFEYNLREGGFVNLDADDQEHAESIAQKYVSDVYPDVRDVEIISVRELKSDGK